MDLAYLGGLLFAIPYLMLKGRGRRILEHIPRRSSSIPARQGQRPCVWVHGVSVGEILSARHFLRKFSENFPGWDVVLSSTTQAGLEAGRRHYPDRPVISYPFDFSYLVRRAFDKIQPAVIVIVEHELWPNFLWHARERGVPVAIVNGRLSERSMRGYRWLSRVMTWPPPGILSFCVEDEVSAEGFRRLGVAPERIRVTGNFKFDNTVQDVPGVREELGLNGKDWVMVGASTHSGEEEMLLDSFARIHREDSRSRLILAPRRVERSGELKEMLERRGFRVFRWSSLRACGAIPTGRCGPTGGCDATKEAAPLEVVALGAASLGSETGEEGRLAWSANGHREVLLVDTIGDLERLSGAADVVFVGGSLVPFGGHNVIAPAGQGRPVVIGPHYGNFSSVVKAFLSKDALVVARDPGDLLAKLRELKTNPEHARGIARRALETVREHSGASERTLEALRPLFASFEGRRVPEAAGLSRSSVR